MFLVVALGKGGITGIQLAEARDDPDCTTSLTTQHYQVMVRVPRLRSCIKLAKRTGKIINELSQ
jgi:hypothetical protein